jgi:hypothetical protein
MHIRIAYPYVSPPPLISCLIMIGEHHVMNITTSMFGAPSYVGFISGDICDIEYPY